MTVAIRNQRAPRPIRVCYVIDDLNTGGTEKQLLRMLESLDRRRIRPMLCLLRGDSAREGEAPAEPDLSRDEARREPRPPACDEARREPRPPACQAPSLSRLGVTSLLSAQCVKAVVRLARLIRRRKIDVVQVYFHDSAFVGLAAGWLGGARHLVRTQFNLGSAPGATYAALNRLINRCFSSTVANSSACRRANRARHFTNRSKVEVIENGIDSRAYKPHPHRRGDGLKIVGVLSNYRKVKQVHRIVEAAATVVGKDPNVIFVIAGEGGERPALERLIAQLGLRHRVFLPGRLRDVARFLTMVDVALLFSSSEGLPNAVMEYMAAGKPIIATAVGGTRDLLLSGVNGVFVHPDDPAGLAQAIVRLLNNTRRSASLGAAARRHVEKCRTMNGVTANYEAHYRRLLSRPCYEW